jgi:hypothetical protein
MPAICFVILVLAVSLLAFNGCAWASETEGSAKTDLGVKKEAVDSKTAPDATGLGDIMVSFKLDPLLTRGMYMGDRWVSPPTFTTVKEGKGLTVVAKARGLSATGKPIRINPEWIPADADMVAVKPGRGGTVQIIVKRAGRTTLKVGSQGISKELSIKATYQDNTIQVDISR